MVVKDLDKFDMVFQAFEYESGIVVHYCKDVCYSV